MRYTNQFGADAAEEMSPSPADVETELDQRLADAKARFGELDAQARRLVKERPLAAFGLALAVGLLLGRALGGRRG